MKNRTQKRMARIERKCDRILAELLMMKHGRDRDMDLDRVIDRLRFEAERMRGAYGRERDITLRQYGLKDEY